jgi:hypothetical protein
MYLPKFFQIYELVPQEMFHQYEKQHEVKKLWLLFDDRILITADLLRHRFGTMVVNTWNWGGNNNYRGYRPFNTTVGAALSQHKFGRALDLVPIKVTAEEIRQDIIANPDREEYGLIKAIETDISWFHFDVRNHKLADGGIYYFKP